jgi:hypothetical protein
LVDDTTGADLNRAMTTVREGETLPNFCSMCGAETSRTVWVRARRTDERREDDQWLPIVIGILASFFVGLAFALLGRSQRTSVAIALPQCKDCAAKSGKPEFAHVSWSTHEMTFVVHKSFKRAFLEHRQKIPT